MKYSALTLFLLTTTLSSKLFAEAGSLDSTFGTNGMVTGSTNISNFDQITSLLIEPDGRIVALGYSDISGVLNCAWDLIVYHVDGSIDFKVVDNFQPASCTFAFCVATEIDGEFIVGGAGVTYGSLVKYKVNGEIDTSFGIGGKTEITSTQAVVMISVLSDHKIIIAGAHNNYLELIRLNSNGSVDSSFANDSVVTFINHYSGFDFFGYAMIVKPDGKILIAGNTGESSENFALVQCNSDGTIDSTFGTNGFVVSSFDARSTITSLAIDSNQKIIAAGLTGSDLNLDAAFARYNSDGSLDSTFGINGKVVTPTTFYFCSSAFQQDQKIVFAGTTSNSTQFALTRYNSNGSPDSSFGENGTVTSNITSGGDGANAVAIGFDGKIVAGGSGSAHFALARYISGLDLGILDLSSSTNSVLIYPNPITESATLKYTLQTPETISIHLLDVQGKILKTIIENEKQDGGEHQVEISFPDQLPSGFYFLKISGANGGSVSVKVVK